MTQATRPATHPAPGLPQRLKASLDAVASELARAGESERLEQLRAEAGRRRDAPPIVVVAGEAKVGKSSLINMLVRRPGLSPVAADIATGCRVAFRYGKTEAACVQMTSGELRTIALDEVREWAGAEANPGNAKGVQSVTIALPVPLLSRLLLIDTPGVGGLDAGHGKRTLESLRHADALVFVSDADSALTAPELRFLEQAAERTETVVFALTKTDLASSWQAVAANNHALLEQHAPRFSGAPTIPISSLNAERALGLGAQPDRAELLEESGLPALERALAERVVARTSVLRTANTLRLAATGLRALERRLIELGAAAGGDPAVGEALTDERDRIGELERHWPRRLDRGMRAINLDRSDEMTRALAETRVHYDALSAQADRQQLATLSGQLLDDVAAIADRLATQTSDRVKELAIEIVGEVDSESALATTLQEVAQVTVGRETQLTTPVPKAASDVDRLTTLVSFSSGHSIGAFVLTLPIIGLVGAPLALAGAGVGAVFAWKMGHGRKLLALQADFRTWQREQLGLVQTLLSNEFSRRMITAQTDLQDAVSDYLKRRKAQIDAALTTNQAVRHHGAPAGSEGLTRTNETLKRVRAMLDQTDHLLHELELLGD